MDDHGAAAGRAQSAMRYRQMIDAAFAEHAITVTPQVETDSVASLLAQVAAGNWACIVPHTWLWTSPLGAEIRAVEMVDPALKAQIALATNSTGPGHRWPAPSPRARDSWPLMSSSTRTCWVSRVGADRGRRRRQRWSG